MFKRMDACKILGVTSSATSREIKAAYYRLAKEKHPDLNPKNLEQFKAINEAYDYLSKNPDTVRICHTQQEEHIWRRGWEGFPKQKKRGPSESELRKQTWRKNANLYEDSESKWLESVIIGGFVGLVALRFWFQFKSSRDQFNANRKVQEEIEYQMREDQRLFELYELNMRR